MTWGDPSKVIGSLEHSRITHQERQGSEMNETMFNHAEWNLILLPLSWPKDAQER